MTATYKKQEILEVLEVLIAGIESGVIDPTCAMIEEWYNCPATGDGTKLSVIYRPKGE